MKRLMFFALIVTAVMLMPFGSFAQQQEAQTSAAPAQTEMQHKHRHGSHDPEMIEHHKKMMAEHEEMMKQMDARMQEKVDAMNAAKGDQKVEAMAAVINEMVAQRKQMREFMMKMREERKEFWKEHKGKGGAKSDKTQGEAGKDKPM